MPSNHLVDENRLDAIVRLIETIEGNLPEGFESACTYEFNNENGHLQFKM